jgi:hypothetical protein
MKKENSSGKISSLHLQIVYVYILLGYNRTQGEKVREKFKL